MKGGYMYFNKPFSSIKVLPKKDMNFFEGLIYVYKEAFKDPMFLLAWVILICGIVYYW
jgi:hypothetical protein